MSKIEVCAKCHKPSCSGKMYRFVEKMEHSWPVCESETFIKSGKRYFRYVRGMGEEWDVEVEEAKETGP